MQTRKSKCTNLYANHFYQNINAFLCRAFKQIASQMNIKYKMSYSIVEVLCFLYNFWSFLWFVMFSSVNYKTLWYIHSLHFHS